MKSRTRLGKCFLSCAGIFLASLLALPMNAQAMPVFFTDRTDFDNNTSGLSFESFETPFSTTTMPLVFPDFTITESVGTPGFVSSTSPNIVSDGSRAVQYASNAPSEITLAFNSPVNTFGIDINDFQGGTTSGDLSVRSDTGSFNQTPATTPPVLPSGNTIFFGVIDPVPFSSIAIRTDGLVGGNIGVSDLIGLDALSFGTTQVTAVPEPAAVILLLTGLAGLGWVRRKGSQ